MGKIRASTVVELYKDSQFLRPHDEETGQRTEYYPLYGPSSGGALLSSELERGYFQNLLSLAAIAKTTVCDISSLKADIASDNYLSALGDVRDLYNDFNHFLDSFNLSQDRKVDSGTSFEVVYPVEYLNGLDFFFGAASESDDITAMSNPRLGQGMPGITVEGPVDVPEKFRDPDWHNAKTIRYHVDLAALAAVLGDDLYAPNGIPFVFGMRIAFRPATEFWDQIQLAIQHAVNLVCRRPPVPMITGMTPAQGRAGTVVTVEGEHLSLAQKVTVAGEPVEFTQGGFPATPSFPGTASVIFTVPEGEPRYPYSNDALWVEVTTPGGTALQRGRLWFTRYDRIHSLNARQQEIRAGDILELEIGCLDEVTDVVFIEDLAVFGFTGSEYPATWRMGPVLERMEIVDTFYKRLLFVGVPNGLPQFVSVRVSTGGYSSAVGPLTFVPWGPEITRVHRRDNRWRSREVIISGRNLQYAPTVRFGTTDATVESVSEKALFCVLPEGIDSGRIQVQTPYGVATTPSDFDLASEHRHPA